MSKAMNKFAPEVGERAVRMMLDHECDYVTASHGKASPHTTVRESAGASGTSGGHYRSAVSGRYVTTAHGKASPNTTVKEK